MLKLHSSARTMVLHGALDSITPCKQIGTWCHKLDRYLQQIPHSIASNQVQSQWRRDAATFALQHSATTAKIPSTGPAHLCNMSWPGALPQIPRMSGDGVFPCLDTNRPYSQILAVRDRESNWHPKYQARNPNLCLEYLRIFIIPDESLKEDSKSVQWLGRVIKAGRGRSVLGLFYFS